MPSGFNLEHIQKLSRLSLSQEEKKTFSAQAEEIIRFFEAIQGEAPCSQTLSREKNKNLRPDEIRQFKNPKTIIKNAPSFEDRFFVVPPVIKTDGNEKE